MKSEAFQVRDGAAFELMLLPLLGVGALSLCHELAIGLWVTIVGAVVLRLRWRGERLPPAQLVPSGSAIDQRRGVLTPSSRNKL